jgi:SAM-dependent methyltransferase
LPNWWLDELANAGTEHLDPDYVAAYDRKSQTDWSEDIAVLLRLGVGPSSTVVDIGAGTGTFAIALAPHVARVIGVDISDTMVTTMRSRGVQAVRAGFLTYEHQGERPDAFFTRNSLHHLPDFWKAVALDRIAGMLPPGGVLVLRDLIYSFDPSEVERAMTSWFDAASVEATAGWTAKELAQHVRDEHSTFSWLLEDMLERTGFEIRERWVSPVRTYAAYACVRAA